MDDFKVVQYNPNPDILIVCDPPTANAARRGLIYSRESSSLIKKGLESIGVPKEDTAFINACPKIPDECKGSESRTNKYIISYHEQFTEYVKDIKPKLIVTLGKSALTQVVGKAAKLGKVRGIAQDAGYSKLGVPVLPMYSPNNVMARPELTDMFNADFTALDRLIKSNYRIEESTLNKSVNYEWCLDLTDLLKNPPKALAVDTETTGLAWYKDHVECLVVQLAYKAGHALVVPVHTDYYPELGKRGRARIVAQLKELLENPAIQKSGHNFKFDYHILKKDLGISVKNWAYDTMQLAFCVDDNMTNKSQNECIRRWVPEMSGYNDELEKRIDKDNMMGVPRQDMLMYAGGDADACFRLTHRLVVQAKKDPKNFRTFQLIQMPALKMFASHIETYGMDIDTDELYKLQDTLQDQKVLTYNELIAEVPAKVRRKHLEAGKELSFTRTDFVRDILFTKEGFNLTPRVFTKSTENLKDKSKRIPSTSAKDHLPYFEHNPFVAKLMDFQKLQKMVSTYVGSREENTGFWQYIHGGKIHPSYSLHRTVTGRANSTEPNGQNIPKRGLLAKAYRKVFVPPPGYVIVSADLSQAELRLVAWMANEKNMLKIYQQGGDIHAYTAASNMRLTLEQFNALSREDRSLNRFRAKAVNFGFIYGMWWRKFMTYAKTDYGIDYTEAEAQQVREVFFRTYPALENWHTVMRNTVNRYGEVRALHGSLRRLPSVYSEDEGIRKSSERQAINSPIQRFASDISLIGGSRLVRDADPDIIRPIGFVHDQLITLVREDYADVAPGWLKFYMESIPYEDWFGISPPLPLLADCEIGTKNLGEMEELENTQAVCPDWYREDYDRNVVTATW